MWTGDADESPEIAEPTETHEEHHDNPTNDDPRIQASDQRPLYVIGDLGVPSRLTAITMRHIGKHAIPSHPTGDCPSEMIDGGAIPPISSISCRLGAHHPACLVAGDVFFLLLPGR